MFDNIDNMAQIEREIEGFRGSATVNFSRENLQLLTLVVQRMILLRRWVPRLESEYA